MENSVNLGLVQAVYIGTSPPQNQYIIWFDNTPGQQIHKTFDFVNTQTWIPLSGAGGSAIYTSGAPFTGNGTIGTPLYMTEASTSNPGWVSSSDWNNFNGKLSTIAGITAGGALSGTYPNPTLLGGDLTGTAGVGFIGFLNQSSNPGNPSTGFRLFSSSTYGGALSIINQSSKEITFNTTSASANRVYTYPDASGIMAVINTTPSNGNLLSYNSSTNLFVPFAPTYISGNQNITVSGDATGSGTTAISLAVAWANGYGTYDARYLRGTGTSSQFIMGDGSLNSTQYLPLGGGTMTGTINMGSYNITSSYVPVNAVDLTNKAYVDNTINGMDWKQSVACATTSNITLSGEQVIDTVTTSSSRVLVKNQSTATQNGIYTSGTGAWVRTSDGNTGYEIWGSVIPIDAATGSTNGSTVWINTNSTQPILGTTNVTFTQIGAVTSYIAGTGLTLASNTFSINTSWAGQTALVTLGTVTTGSWTATAIGATYGGTGITSYTLGDTIYSSAANTLSRLSGNTTSTKKFYTQTGTGTVSAAPAWNAIAFSDLPTTGLTNNSIVYWNNGLAQDNNNLYWNDSGTPYGNMSIGCNGDFTGTNTVNIFNTLDVFAFNSANTAGGAVTNATTSYSTSRGTIGAFTPNQNNDYIGSSSYWAQTATSAGGSWNEVASIRGYVEYSTGMGGRIELWTASNAGGTETKRLSINNIGTTTIYNNTTANNTTSPPYLTLQDSSGNTMWQWNPDGSVTINNYGGSSTTAGTANVGLLLQPKGTNNGSNTFLGVGSAVAWYGTTSTNRGSFNTITGSYDPGALGLTTGVGNFAMNFGTFPSMPTSGSYNVLMGGISGNTAITSYHNIMLGAFQLSALPSVNPNYNILINSASVTGANAGGTFYAPTGIFIGNNPNGGLFASGNTNTGLFLYSSYNFGASIYNSTTAGSIFAVNAIATQSNQIIFGDDTVLASYYSMYLGGYTSAYSIANYNTDFNIHTVGARQDTSNYNLSPTGVTRIVAKAGTGTGAGGDFSIGVCLPNATSSLTSLGSCTVSSSIVTITTNATTLKFGNVVQFTGTLGGSVSASTNYWIVNCSASGTTYTFQVAATYGGTPLTFTGSGVTLFANYGAWLNPYTDAIKIKGADGSFNINYALAANGSQSVTGGVSTATANSNIRTLYLDSVGATIAVTLSASPQDGMELLIATNQTTLLTVSANAGQSVIGVITSISLSSTGVNAVCFKYRASNTTWYRLY